MNAYANISVWETVDPETVLQTLRINSTARHWCLEGWSQIRSSRRSQRWFDFKPGLQEERLVNWLQVFVWKSVTFTVTPLAAAFIQSDEMIHRVWRSVFCSMRVEYWIMCLNTAALIVNVLICIWLLYIHDFPYQFKIQNYWEFVMYNAL